MLYDVRVAPHSGGEDGRFELERDEPLKAGELFTQVSMIYKVVRVRALPPSEGDFDAVAEVEWAAGPAERHLSTPRSQPFPLPPHNLL